MKALSMILKRLTRVERQCERIAMALNGQPTRRRKKRKASKRKEPVARAGAPNAPRPKRASKKKPAKKSRDLRSVPPAE